MIKKSYNYNYIEYNRLDYCMILVSEEKGHTHTHTHIWHDIEQMTKNNIFN